MAETPETAEFQERNDATFPKLTESQIARLKPFGRSRVTAPGEVIFDEGERRRAFYVVIRGRLQIVTSSQHPGAPPGETTLGEQGPGQFTGELDMLSGRKSLVRSRSIEDGEL